MKKKTIIGVVVIVAVLCSLLVIALNNNLSSAPAKSSYVHIGYTGYTSKTIPLTISGLSYEQKAGEFNTFLQVSIDLKNYGYESFSTNPDYFRVIVDKVRYSVDATTLALIGNWKTVDVLNDGSITGVLIFQVPEYIQDFTLNYESTSLHYNIAWDKTGNITSLD